jgi:hypothetical protein
MKDCSVNSNGKKRILHFQRRLPVFMAGATLIRRGFFLMAFHAKSHRKSVFMDPTRSGGHLNMAGCARFFVIRVSKNDVGRDAVNPNPLHLLRKRFSRMAIPAGSSRGKLTK